MESSYITIDGRQYRPEIINACERRLNDMTKHRGKVYLVRFDVHYPVGYPAPETATLVSALMRRFKDYYNYHGAKTHYVGVREKNTSQNPHYHIALFIDGSMFDNGSAMLRRLTQIWSRLIGVEAEGLIHWCRTFAGDYGLKIQRPRDHVSDLERHPDKIALRQHASKR